MPFNADDYKQPPFQPGCMTLNNDEVIKVQDKCSELEKGFVPDDFNTVINDNWVIARYNESNNYEEAVNGDTYTVIKGYNREINTQGINENGIVPEPVVEEPEEEPTKEQPEEVEETPVEEEVQSEPETTTEEEEAPEEAPEATEAE